MMTATLSLQDALRRWNEVEENFLTEIRSPESISMRDRDVWHYAIDVYNAIQVGEKLDLVKMPFTDLSCRFHKQKLSNLMWEIYLDEDNIVLEKKYTPEGRFYSIRVDDTFEIAITPEEVTTDIMWECPLTGTFHSPIGKKIVEALGLQQLTNVCYASENCIRFNVMYRDCCIELTFDDSAREAIREWQLNNQVSKPLTIEFKVSWNNVGERTIR